MDRELQQMVLSQIIPLVRTTLKETAELTGAIQVLADRMERLVAELAEGELLELTRLVARALRTLETMQIAGGRS